MWAPKVSLDEGLSVETQHFVDCIVQDATPLTDGKVGLRIVRILEAATRSLRQGGCPVQL